VAVVIGGGRPEASGGGGCAWWTAPRNSVAITGTGFSTVSGLTTFNFGANGATGVSCSSSTSCTVTAPAGALGAVDVRATVAGLTSATNPGDAYTYVSQLVSNWYQRFLHRPVDPTSLVASVNAMSHGVSDEVVIAAIVGSDEYFSHM
jgi:hypothetical protein